MKHTGRGMGVTRLALAGAAGALAAAAAYTVAAYRASRPERQGRMPGDAFIPRPMFTMTQAITINAPPEAVWPWLIQMGAGRAGWYSYDWIDDEGRPSLRDIVPALQHVKPGDIFPALPGATEAFIVTTVESPHNLTLTAPANDAPRVSWEFLLAARPRERTRLLVRVRVSPKWLEKPAQPTGAPANRRFIERVYDVLPHLPGPLLHGVASLGHRAMQNQQLRGIKHRAEAEWRRIAPATAAAAGT
jgi:hypothetical protein